MTLIVAVAGAAELRVEPDRVCAVGVQDRARVPAGTSDLDALLEGAIVERGFEVVVLPFDRPADVEYAAREKGCTYILYTDIARADETAGSRVCRAFKRLGGGDGAATMNAEVEFRLFRVDEVLPIVSTSVAGKSTGGRLSPHVSSRVVELHSAFAGTAPATRSLRADALSEAFQRQARIMRLAVK